MAVDALARTLAAEIAQTAKTIKSEMDAMEDEFAIAKAQVGTPLVAADAAAMTDHNKIYVYIKDPAESGYTTGNWYFWSGSAWESGGIYQSSGLETDTTLSIPGMAADAKATGDEFTSIKNSVYDTQSLNWSDYGNETYPLGWRTGYYNKETGAYSGSNAYIGTRGSFVLPENAIELNVSAPTGYYCIVYEYNASGTYLRSVGNHNPNNPPATSSVNILVTKNYRYNVALGRFNDNSAASHLTSEFISTIIGAIKYLAIPDYVGSEYDASSTYKVGDFCIHGGFYQKCIDDIEIPELWTPSHWENTTISAELSSLNNNISQMTSVHAYDWHEMGNSTYPTGWCPGYYSSENGEVTSSNVYLRALGGISFPESVLEINATVPDGYGVRIHEWDIVNGVDHYMGYYGNTYPPSGDLTPSVNVTPVTGHIYKFQIGRFDNLDAEDYNNDTFLSNVILNIKKIKSSSISKKARTGDFEFFTVDVARPLSFGDEETSETTETVECVLRLPASYRPDGEPTRLVLACHGASGYIQASTSTWYNSNWRSFMDTLLEAGYAVFDSNVLPTSTGTSQMGYAVGSPLYVNVLRKAYDYIQENYNVHRQIFAHGTSMGGVGATAFSHAYPELVLAESSFAGRDFLRYLITLEDGTASEDRFAISYGYESLSELASDKFSHCEGCFPSLSVVKYVNGVAQIPPDRETDYQNWLSYYCQIADLGRDDNAGVWMGKRTVPYKAWNSWSDNEAYTKLQIVLQKAYNRGNSCPYYLVNYESGTHTQMSYGQINDMIPQLIAWYKRWE